MIVNKKRIEVKEYNKEYLNEIIIYDVHIHEDINYFFANYILFDYLPNKINDISFIDYKKIYHLSKELYETSHFFNNGVIYEWLVEEVISKNDKLIPLIKVESDDLERPDYGPDIIFLNKNDLSIHFFEVKSSERSNTITSHANLFYKSLESLYLKKHSRKSLKLIDAKEQLSLQTINERDKKEIKLILEYLLNTDSKMFDVRKNKSIYINSSTFTKKANYLNESNFADEFNEKIEYFMEKFLNEYKKINNIETISLDNITIIHRFINIIVDTEVLVKTIYSNMMDIIKDEGLDHE